MRQRNTAAVGGDMLAHDHRIYVAGSFSISACQPGPSRHANVTAVSLWTST